ncbi:protein unc-80 homolog isoform X4 [Zootermopsis nevadensis]|uniref:protein unc-80 homolog isoform X4 n=1 Tax=Zootermopsis nevadensis TaxID=136037 RepID=UPI000B8EE4D6|nr:protein unc-80 homolog isoform X4 [Zootermopsis nevadensis]
MDRRTSLDDSFNDQALPIPIQIFLWRQVSPFIRPKLGKLHEASCMSFEKVLVQNIQFGLSPSLTEAIKSIPRWRLIQASLPHVLHCAASLLHNRKDTNLQNLGAAETKLLYTLHWIVLDAAEECADADYEKGIYHASPFYYLFSIPAISLFIYLFAPICHHLKESDFQNYRLENGLKIWQAMWEYQHPDTACFTSHVKPKPQALWAKMLKCPLPQFGDVFLGRKCSSEEGFMGTESPPSQSASVSFSDQAGVIRVECRPGDEENWLSSPKDTIFPETIPEESSSTEEEHVVIFRLPSLPESDTLKESSIYTAETSVFHVAMGRNDISTKSTLTIEQVTAISGSDMKQLRTKPAPIQKMGSSTDKDSIGSNKQQEPIGAVKTQENGQGTGSSPVDICSATFLDVAVLRCLFIPEWQEEGVYWALQFYYHRLHEISDYASSQQQPRKRSNSLPIPKIEVSLYQSPELMKQESKDFMEVPEVKDVSYLTESPYFGQKQPDDQGSHVRRASEKVKKRMKMADLKAFVETKLLSISEKTLEKIGRDEPKVFYGQDYHRSLDTGDEHLSRPCSAFAKIFEPKSDLDKAKHSSNLVKGKSMPSLRYIGEVHSEKVKQTNSVVGNQPCSVKNPIITVTEHTPTPSPDYMKRQGSIDSQLDAISLQGRKLNQERKTSLTRSQTDSNITYTGEEVPEAQGSMCYITKDGDIDYQVVLKAVHSAAVRDNVCCTLRVCEVILNLVELLMDMGVLKQCLRDEAAASGGENHNVGGSLYAHGHGHHVSQQGSGKRPKGTEYVSPSAEKGRKLSCGSHKGIAKLQTPHSLIMSCVIRVLKHLGCPHGCADGQRGPPADFLRSQGQTILSKLHRASPRQFSRFLREMVCNQSISDILDFFHAYVGFCVDPSSLLSPLNQKRSCSKSPDIISQGGYATNFGAGLGGGGSRGIEGQIMASVFKALVTRMAKSAKELKTQENMALYCDVRQLMTYIKEAHGGVFRRVALSGLLESASRPHRKEPNTQTTRVIKHLHHNELDDPPDIGGSSCFVMDERGSRKMLFKKRSTSSTCASLLETELGEEISKASQSPLGNLRKKHHILTPRQSERNLGTVELPHSSSKSRKSSRFQIGGFVNWFRREYGRTESTNSRDDNASPVEGAFIRQASLHYSHSKNLHKAGSSQMGHTLQKAKRRMEDHFNKFGFGKMKKKDGSVEETPGSCLSRHNSLELGDHSRESEFVVLKERKLVPILPIRIGMLRFSFLLETCQPGSMPDPHLLAAALDLPHAPVVSRAALFLECSYFVHCCNKGQWPNWMKLNFPIFRPSGPLSNRGAPSGLRRIHILQRTAGKMFHQWAEAVGARLEEMVQEDKQHVADFVSMVTEECQQKELLMVDEEEDFLDEASVNLYGLECPIALRLLACILLLEITAFLRETYQTLPKSCRLSAKERPSPWERMCSREVNRRWSMALSSMGHSQTSAQSLQSIVGDKDAALQSERKISFVLHEPDNGSEGSSNTTVTMQGEENQTLEDKKGRRSHPSGRPFLLRRGTAGATSGSFKRRSLKLRRGKEAKEILDCDFSVKRTDSVQSKRKVSSLSDRSDTSEQGVGDVSGEESPGILSDDQPLESPSDSNDTDDTAKSMPWMKVVVQVANSFNFYCSHQSFCHPFCYRRHMRACSRLVKSVRRIYGEEFGIMGGNARESDGEKHQREDTKKDKSRGRKVSEQTSTQASPIRRKDSVGRKDRTERNADGSHSGRPAGSHRDSSRDIADQSIEKCYGSQQKSSVVSAANLPSGKTLKKDETEKLKEQPPILKYIKTQVRDVFHAPLAVLVKGAVILSEEYFVDILPIAWELLLEANQEVAATAASLFILAAVRAPNQATDTIHHGLHHQDPAARINAILRFQVLWKLRYQVWPRMEEGAHLTFKVPPPGIEFTLPSPKIGIESLPVVDPPWMPQVKTKVEEVTISQESHRSLVTATKTRKKQQTELIKMALQAQEDKRRTERENFLITTIPITVQAAYEPSLYHAVGDDHDEGDEEQTETQPRNAAHHVHSAHSLFPSSLCSAVIQIINLLDDAAVSPDGNAVYEVAYQVIWSCLVEDSALFLRYVLERLTRDKQEMMFKILRHLIRFIPKLPQQAAFALYNYIIGYVMFYVRSPQEDSQKLIGTALSVLWMVVHSVHGIMFKDLKQILRKEQCDASILLTANVPSAKKIIVHGPQEQDAGGIPSQFPVQEDTQFCQILRESLDFFGIEEPRHKEFFLVDHKTHQIHNPSAYVRDYYFFKRSQYPQLELVHMKPEEAFNALQRQELIHKFVEIGKVLLTWAILKNVDMVVQRVVFLHEELMKLPSFPRKALEADLDLYKGGEMGKELLGLDVLHKFMWVRLIARMFEAMAGNFAYSGDIHLFLNVLNGAVILHSEDACILRYVTATYINAAHNFKNIFSTNGYLLIMPTLLQLYSNHQTNKLVRTTVEYTVKQFYLMNRKPFILQMFGSVSAILDTDDESLYGDAHKVQSNCLFNLLLSLETPSPDPLNIGELVREEKPLKAIDFCYHDESEMVTVLDCISLCVMVVAYAADSVRGHQMLTILEAILPCYVQHIQLPIYKKEGKTEKEIIHQLAVAIRTLINNCEALAKNYNGPQRASPEHKGSSQRNYSRGPYSPAFEFEEDSHSRYVSDHSRSKIIYERDKEDSEVLRSEFRRPRDILLSMVAEFHTKCTVRLNEINKKSGQDSKTIELLDIKSHVRLADIAHSLLKVSPYDPDTMACRGLQHYMSDILPSTEWTNEAMRPALISILRRLDKTFNKIYKKPSIRRHTDWEAAAGLLKGIYETLARYPYLVHMQHLKTLINTCQALIVGETTSAGMGECMPSATAALMCQVPPPHFCSTVVRLIALQILAVGETYSLEQVCGGNSTFPTHEKTENMLMNLLMPLCLRVGSGRKDVPHMRQVDISFALTVVLHAMNPPASKTAPVTAQNIKTASEMRAGSLTYSGRGDNKKHHKVSSLLFKVSFLALKIMIICFEGEMVADWPRIARTIRDLGKRNEAGSIWWNFIDFVVSQRIPLFVLLQHYILFKLCQPPVTDHERYLQFLIREKLKGFNLPIVKCKGMLLMDLAHEMKELKEELEDHRYDIQQGHHGPGQPTEGGAGPHQRQQRPSVIDLLTGDHGTGKDSMAKPDTTTTSQPARQVLPVTQARNRWNVAAKLACVMAAAESVSSVSFGSSHSAATAARGTGETIGGGVGFTQTSTPANSLVAPKLPLTDKSQQSSSSSASDERKLSSQKFDASLPQQKTSIRFVSSVECKHSSGETSSTPLSPSSPADESSGELSGHPNKPRLQRSKAQSRNTFRLRRSRKSRIEVSHIKVEPSELSVEDKQEQENFPKQQQQQQQQQKHKLLSQQQQKQASTADIPSRQPAVVPVSSAAATCQQLPSASVLCARRLSVRQSRSSDNAHSSVADVSWDEVSQTSSTSGYRESYSLLMMALEGPPTPTGVVAATSVNNRASQPPLASPDVHDLPSTSSAATNQMAAEGSSPESSINSGEDLALLEHSVPHSSSLHSLFMAFEPQDEDTLI